MTTRMFSAFFVVLSVTLTFAQTKTPEKAPAAATQKPSPRGAVLETPVPQFTIDKKPGYAVLAEIAKGNTRGVLHYLRDGKPVPLTRENLGVNSDLVREFLKYCVKGNDVQQPVIKGGPCSDAIVKMRQATTVTGK